MINSIIVAMDEKGGIAFRGELPWNLPAEKKRFKQTTLGHYLLMGRKTYESIGKPLPGRMTIVITRQQNFHPNGCLVTHSLEQGFSLARNSGVTELFICGGGEIYNQSLPIVDRIYLTVIHTQVPTDIGFPTLIADNWQEIYSQHQPKDEKNPFPFTWKILNKKPATKVDKP